MELDFHQNETIYVIDTSGFIMLESTFKADNHVF